MRLELMTLAALAAGAPALAGSSTSEVLPRRYVCYRAQEPPVIDGRLAEASWLAVPWTGEFLDIEGFERPAPRLRTRARMLWDDRFFYVGAELEEPHVWATLTRRDSVIFHDNDFEVFIDPDGDTHLYCELEVNAFGTDWDLLLVRPYRDGGPSVQRWDIAGLQTEVHVDGTINDPADEDRGWSVEIAIPWAVLAEVAGRPCPPRPGNRWWVNFSRVEWQTHVADGGYIKDRDPATGKVLPENNWVWSPQGVIDMHRPESWGLVQFSALAAGAGAEEFVPLPDLPARAALRQVYDRQRLRLRDGGAFVTDVAALGIEDPRLDGWQWPPEIYCTPALFHAILRHEAGGRLQITQDGRIWFERE